MGWSAPCGVEASNDFKREDPMVKMLGIDIGKSVFHVVGLDDLGRVVIKKRLTRVQLFVMSANLAPCLIGLEACPGAHYLARRLHSQGHTVRLLPPQYVRPYVKSHKNDFVDAEAIAEAVGRPTMRFVPPKTVAQLDLQALHRVRDRLVMRRTGLINQVRAFLLEQGLPLRSGRRVLQRELPVILANEDTPISARLRQLLSGLWQEWQGLETQLTDVTATIGAVASEDAACQRLLEVPGVGPLTATALVAAIGTGEAFRKGRDFASWLGLVPRQHSTGGKPRLLGISKRGNSHLRRLFVLGAHSVARHVTRQRHGFGAWLTRLQARTHPNVATVALANKLARIAWAVLRHGTPYRPGLRAAA